MGQCKEAGVGIRVGVEMKLSGKDEEISVVVGGERRMVRASQLEGLMNMGLLCVGCGYNRDRMGSACLELINAGGFPGCWHPEGVILVED